MEFSGAARGPRGAGPPEAEEQWAALFRRASLDDVLHDLARWLSVEPSVEIVVRAGDVELGRFAREVSVDPGPRATTVAEIGGRPPWELAIRGPAGRTPSREAVGRAAASLAAWRAAREEVERAGAGVVARGHELLLLQELSHGAARARSPEDLFRRTAELLQAGSDADAVIVASAFDVRPDVRAYLARPIDDRDLNRAVSRTCRTLGLAAGSPPTVEVRYLDAFEDGCGVRPEVARDETHVLPVGRRGRTVAAVGLLLPERVEAPPRIAFVASNQLALHLDRILTLREAEEGRFRSILDSMPHAVFLTDRSLRVLHGNPAARELTDRIGFGEGRLGRVGTLDLGALTARVARGSHAAGGEARLEDGTILDVTASAVTAGEGEAEGLVVVMADVTAARKVQEQLARADKLSSLGQMISGVAHELNNPLASVVGYAQLLGSEGGDPGTSRRLATIQREARRCQRIVQDLLSFARRHEPRRQLLSLNDVVRSAVGLVAYQLKVDNVETRLDLDPGLPAVEGDPHQLEQVLLNLITNARHAIREATGRGSIALRTLAPRPGRASVEVRDDGPGMSRDVLSKIYDPFFTTKGPGRGTGLGLAIVHRLVTSHGGSVEVDSRPGAGTTFRIELPVGSRRAGATGRGTPLALRSSGRTGRFLVVDDEEAVARMICEALESAGHEVMWDQDRPAALERLEGSVFDGVVLDVRMPGMEEREFLDELERRQPGLSRRVVLVSGDTFSRETDALASRLSVPVLHKPFDIPDLLAAAGACLQEER